MKKWILVYGKYEGQEAKAAELLSAKAEEYIGYELAVYRSENVNEKFLEEHSVIYVGTISDHKMLATKYKTVADGDLQGYVYEVVKKDDGNDIYVVGNTALGAYYGATAFISHYLPNAAVLTSYNSDFNMFGNFNLNGFFRRPFNEQMPESKEESAPAVRTRAIWTWGHVIFDYEKFFENMALLRLNEIVIWNDHMPVNATEVVKAAHDLGIRVIFGFSWGWGLNCGEFAVQSCFDKNKVNEFAQKVSSYYEEEVFPTGADGIYFQSFTELNIDNICGVNIAEAVAAWVNGIAAVLYEKYPEIEIQFGLHATSVKEHLKYLQAVDKRIRIVWEDCGAFPYNYSPVLVQNSEETAKFTETALNLRGKDEKFAAVFKGLTTLYWDTFDYREGPFILGKASNEKIATINKDRAAAWKFIQAMWLKNAEYVRKTTEMIAKGMKEKSEIQLLAEYGTFETHIYFPVALAAEIMWSPTEDTQTLIERATLNPYVYFENI